jgi:hypothetical protein
MHPRQLAKLRMECGIRVLPLYADKSPVTHLVRDGFKDATDDPSKLWWFDHDDTELVGMVPGSAGMLVLDIDVKKGVNGYDNLRRVGVEEGQDPANVWWMNQVHTPSGGMHVYLMKPDPNEHIGNFDLCPGVNVRCDGGYVVDANNDMAGYRIEGSGTFAWEVYQAAPEWVMRRLRAARDHAQAMALDEPYDVPEARLEPMGQWNLNVHRALDLFQDDGDRHGSMLMAVASLCSYELMGYAGATTALAQLEDLFVAAVSDRSDEGSARREYRRALSGARERVRANESVGLAERAKDRTFIERIILDAGGDESDVEKVLKIEPTHLRVWSMAELMESDLTLRWLVRNVLVSPTYGQIAGSKKTLKTYLAQYLALAIATGEPFMGQFPVEKQGNVLLFVGEGGRIPWTRRMPRIAKSVGINDIRDVPIHAVFQTAPLLSPAFKQTVEASIERLDPVLTVIDPFYAFHGSDVNSANIHEEGALLTAAADPFIHHGSTFMIVNHFKKGPESRGLDAITMAGSGEWVDSWVFTSQRELPDLNAGMFYISVEFGSRQWGGSRWDFDLSIGKESPMGEEPETPITFEIRRSYA